MSTEKIITVLEADEVLRRLRAVLSEPHVEERFYSTLLRMAGQPRTGAGISTGVMLAFFDYTSGLPPVIAAMLTGKIPEYLAAFTDDKEVLAEARQRLVTAGVIDA